MLRDGLEPRKGSSIKELKVLVLATLPQGAPENKHPPTNLYAYCG